MDAKICLMARLFRLRALVGTAKGIQLRLITNDCNYFNNNVVADNR